MAWASKSRLSKTVQSALPEAGNPRSKCSWLLIFTDDLICYPFRVDCGSLVGRAVSSRVIQHQGFAFGCRRSSTAPSLIFSSFTSWVKRAFILSLY